MQVDVTFLSGMAFLVAYVKPVCLLIDKARKISNRGAEGGSEIGGLRAHRS